MAVWRLGGDLLAADMTLNRSLAFGATAYSGPGDVKSGATAWWGLRAYTLASIGGNCVDIIRASDSTTQTFVTVSGGGVDIVSINTFLTSTTGKITKLWDQTGNSNHLTQGTDANRPAITLSGIGSLPIITFASGNFLSITNFNASSDISQPFTISTVYKDTGSATTSGAIVASNNGSGQVVGLYSNDGATDRIEVYAGTGNNTAATNNTWFALQGVFNGASSDANLNGTSNTVSANTHALAHQTLYFGTDGSSDNYVGKATEAGVWASAFSGTNSSNMSTNQRNYWGF